MRSFQPFRVICIFVVVFFALGTSLVMGTEKMPRIAVMEIKNLKPDKETDWIGAAAAETLSTKLCGVSSISVVERRHINKVIEEQKFQLLGPIDSDTAVEVGKLVGADVVVVGSFASHAGQVQFNVRFVDVETGEVRNAASLTGKVSEIFQLNYELAEAAIESLNKKVVIIKGTPVVREVPEARKVKLTAEDKKWLQEQGTTSTEAYKYFGQALEFGRAESFDKEIELYTRAIQLDPNYSWAYLTRGTIYYHKGDHDQAIADYNRVLELNPKYVTAYSNRGVAYASKGDHDRAMADYNRALELNPKYADAYNNRGTTYYHKGDYDQAIADFNRALELNPKYVDAYTNRGAAYASKGDHDRAMADYTRAFELNPNDTATRYNKACSYSLQNDKVKALENLYKAIRMDAKYKKIAKQDKDFKNIWDDKDFKKIVD